MIEIALVTLNSTYQHASFGLRYLHANLKEYQSRCQIFEVTIHRKAQEVVDLVMAHQPRIVGFGVYIWNTKQTLKVVELLREQYPNVIVVLGGPEVSYETETQPICQLANYTICGEADFLFYEFCHRVLTLNDLPTQKVIRGQLPDIAQIISPYSLYSDNDIENRIIYVEASRGCPYKCEYCLSSLDKSVRNFPLDPFLADLEALIQRGTKQFKFIDRTFNLSPSISQKILQFFLDRIDHGLFLHFEMVPDRLPEELKILIQKFPAGSLQFEIGVQTWNPKVAALVSRRQDYSKVKENLTFLKEQTVVHTHVDLIAGLPGEDLESFAQGFDQLALLAPDEIQLGILKRLKGTPIIRHDCEWEMVYSSEPPFQILQTKLMSAATLEKFQKFSKFWDLIANSGNFKGTYELIQARNQGTSLFQWFWNLTDFLTDRHPQAHSIHLLDLFKSVLIYLQEHCQWDDSLEILSMDYQRGRPGAIPHFLRFGAPTESNPKTLPIQQSLSHPPKRQRQHLQ